MNRTPPTGPPETSLLAVLTLVLWTLPCAVTAIGFAAPYPRPHAAQKEEAPIVAEILQVQLTREAVATLPADPAPVAEPPPVAPPIEQLDPLPNLTPVAEPSVVAFALPVEGPVRLVAPATAAYAVPAEIPATNRPEAVFSGAPQQLVYGQGDGRQPAPEYPYRARKEGQEGVVKVRFTVGPGGQVLSADAAAPSPWPMLNQSAVRAVLERWRFQPGAARAYEVAIKFQLAR